MGENRLISVNTANDRTLFFDLLPLDLGRILGHTFKIQLYTVPGQVRYEATRRVVLSGADAVVFVADSQRGRSADNRAAWDSLLVNLKLNGIDPLSLPIVVQCNKQDVEGALTPDEVEASLRSGRETIGTSATRCQGVVETFRAAVLLMLKRLATLTGRRRAEDLEAIEEQVARAFAAIGPCETAGNDAGSVAGAAAVIEPASTADPGTWTEAPSAPQEHARPSVTWVHAGAADAFDGTRHDSGANSRDDSDTNSRDDS